MKLIKSPNKSKKFRIIFDDGSKVDFGATGYSNYTIHKDKVRMKLYLGRHRKRENWTKSGIKTAGFWARWILWNKPSLRASIRNVEKRFNLKIVYSGKA